MKKLMLILMSLLFIGASQVTNASDKSATAKNTMANSIARPHRHHWHRYYRPYNVVTVVSKPAVTIHVNNHLNQKERFKMAMAYLKNHDHLTVKKYAKMTGLSKMAAEAELDAFVADKDKSVIAVVRGKKKVYIMKKRT